MCISCFKILICRCHKMKQEYVEKRLSFQVWGSKYQMELRYLIRSKCKKAIKD